MLSTGYGVQRTDPSGMSTLEAQIRDTIPQATVYRDTWDADWAQQARLHSTGGPLVWCGHSYGAWVALQRFAKVLKRRRIALACLVDPVPRIWDSVLTALFGALGGEPAGCLKLPANIDRAIYWRQINGIPMGSPVRGRGRNVIGVVYYSEDPPKHRRQWESIVKSVPGLDHDEIDSWPAVRRAILNEIVDLWGRTL